MKAITTRILELIDFFKQTRRFARKANVDPLIHIDFLHKKQQNFRPHFDDLIAKLIHHLTLNLPKPSLQLKAESGRKVRSNLIDISWFKLGDEQT